jgi:3-hydroxyisobutyrate dehydrogenase-like beta-hydroxyacid dehydrogenase
MMAAAQPIHRVAILSPGEMGHAVGRVLRENGLDVITCLAGRSERTRSLSRRAALREVESFADLVRDVDLVLSIIVPSAAMATIQTLADAVRAAGTNAYVADCNAVSPEAAVAMDKIVADAGGRFVDASIIGFPPADGVVPRFYVSGPHADALRVLDGKGIEVVPIGDRVGQASGIKMCYAGLTKGTFALSYAVALAAENMGLLEDLCRELAHSQPHAYEQMQRHLPKIPAKARRWIGEMEQIASAFEHAHVTPRFHEAAAATYCIVSKSSLADETPETIGEGRSLQQTIGAIAKHLSGAQS